MHNYKDIIKIFAKAARQAGIFAKNFRQNHKIEVENKYDFSPVTFADYESHRIISRIISEALPHIPIISEELTDHTGIPPHHFILVDPIDGTKGYIRGGNDYSVNIALIEDNRPIVGVLYVPEDDELFFASHLGGSFLDDKGHLEKATNILVRTPPIQGITLAVSYYKAHKVNYQALGVTLPIQDFQNIGSAKKFTLLARGTADLYPRLGQTGEWDTAAGDILLTEAGGAVHTIDNAPILYGKKNFLNEGFIAFSHKSLLEENFYHAFFKVKR